MPVKAPQLVLGRNESVSAGSRRIVDELIKSAIACIKQPSTDREEDLHQVRWRSNDCGPSCDCCDRSSAKRSLNAKTLVFALPPGVSPVCAILQWRDARLNRSLTSSRAIHRTLRSRKSLKSFSLKPPHRLVTTRTVNPRSDSLREPSRKRAVPFTRCLCPIVVGKQSNRV